MIQQQAQGAVNGPPLSLGGKSYFLRAFLATRPPFYVASILPVLVGTAWAGAAFHRFDVPQFVLALLVTMVAHAAANVFNDVGDDVTGADPGNQNLIYPYTGGSRFIQAGLLTRAQMLRLAGGLALVAVLLGLALVALRGPWVIAFGVGGLALGLFYSLPGVQLSGMGFGELCIAIAFGVLPALGSVWLQAGTIDIGAVLLSLPVAAWVAAILLINEVPDRDSDASAGKRTLVVRWGIGGTRWIYSGLTVVALGASLAGVWLRALPMWYAVIAVLLAAWGFKAAAGIAPVGQARAQLKRSIEFTLAIHAVGGALLIGAILFTLFKPAG